MVISGKNNILLLKFFFKRKLLFKNFIISFVWVTFPILLVFIPKINSEISNNKSLLTPYSVSVNGYTRSDGVVISSYSRRPPGSVKRDKPIEDLIDKLEFTKKILYFLFIVSVIIFIYLTDWEIKHIGKEFQEYVHFKILKKMKYNFHSLTLKPKNIIYRKNSGSNHSFRCDYIFCENATGFTEFYYLELSEGGRKKICVDCMKKQDPKFHNELLFIYRFYSNRHFFKKKYMEVSNKFFNGYINDSTKPLKYFTHKVQEIWLNQK